MDQKKHEKWGCFPGLSGPFRALLRRFSERDGGGFWGGLNGTTGHIPSCALPVLFRFLTLWRLFSFWFISYRPGVTPEGLRHFRFLPRFSPILFGEGIGGTWRAAEGPSPLLKTTNKKRHVQTFWRSHVSFLYYSIFCFLLELFDSPHSKSGRGTQHVLLPHTIRI